MIINAFPTGWDVTNQTGGGSSASPVAPLLDFTYTGNYETIDDGNGDWRLRLLTSGTLTFLTQQVVDLFAVGGGGGGANYQGGMVGPGGGQPDTGTWSTSGGGGGGGYTTTVTEETMIANHAYTVNIGAGGTAGQDGGATSMDSTISASGGKKGASTSDGSGGAGGSGGGRGSMRETYFDGSDAFTVNASNGGSNGGNGEGTSGGTGQGTTTREFGEPDGTLYGSGGAGGNHLNGTQHIGGGSGGGNGACLGSSNYPATAGYANTGGGGGGGASTTLQGQSGGSGILIIRNHREQEEE